MGKQTILHSREPVVSSCLQQQLTYVDEGCGKKLMQTSTHAVVIKNHTFIVLSARYLHF